MSMTTSLSAENWHGVTEISDGDAGEEKGPRRHGSFRDGGVVSDSSEERHKSMRLHIGEGSKRINS